MKPVLLLSFLAALGCHGFILFGWALGTAAKSLPVAGESASVSVKLVESAPGAEAVAEATPEAPPPGPTPTPEPTPEPAPEPAPPRPDATPAQALAAAPTPPLPLHPHPAASPRKISSNTETKPRQNSNGGSPEALAAQPGNHGSGESPLPHIKSNPKPDYPREALAAKHEGVVMISVEVSAEGRPNAVTLAGTSGYPELDASALRTLWRWRFEPAHAAGIAVAMRINVPVRFRLDQR